ncbi:PTS sugar transporter subunit IIA [Aminobacter aganoensis]|uniref:PTS system nitrogen regulatory IIA component n=1 Tax=Aminobacter aganoensis TaxID=83264 RepID=A0A7X0FBA6_9HYPH|nr:PTS sugar transporter subunit IIA [Aminobacter aganoensis]MBB6356516.1 PTS system nitrogen regulatory IIA component [Aminobacter aganoensis]
MQLQEILAEDGIDLAFVAKEKHSALAKLAVMLATKAGIDDKPIRLELLARERLGATGVGWGIAIPHALMDGLSKPVACMARLKEPIDFGAIDDAPVDILFGLLWPRSNLGTFLPALSYVARTFRDQTTRHLIRQATTPAAVLSCFDRCEEVPVVTHDCPSPMPDMETVLPREPGTPDGGRDGASRETTAAAQQAAVMSWLRKQTAGR